MKIKHIFLSLLLVCLGYVSHADTKFYQNQAISLTIPANWQVAEEDIDRERGYLVLEGEITGQVIVKWVDTDLYEPDSLSEWASDIVDEEDETIPSPVIGQYGNREANVIVKKLEVDDARTMQKSNTLDLIEYTFLWI